MCKVDIKWEPLYCTNALKKIHKQAKGYRCHKMRNGQQVFESEVSNLKILRKTITSYAYFKIFNSLEI